MNLLKYYVKLKEIISIVENGDWRNHTATKNLTISEIERIRKAIKNIEKRQSEQIRPIYVDKPQYQFQPRLIN